MPSRKLSQSDLDDLRDAESELLRSHPRRITRRNGDGHPVEITTLKQLAQWKGISESHFYTHKRSGFTLKRGVPFEDKTPDTVPADTLRVTFDLFQEALRVKDRRIAALEAELEQLRRGRQP